MSMVDATAGATNSVPAKALAINLSPAIYGSFAEIGAGQEVARWFLRVGAASGTVAQTISAYDKTFSDATYGSGTRYVSKERLEAMLEREFRVLRDRLGKERGDRTCFFAFAVTAAARSYKGDNDQHAWVGLRFQIDPHAEPSDVRLHVNLMDPSAELQAEALGYLGVNLIYAAYHQRGSAGTFLEGLFDELSVGRLEVDVVELAGPAFRGVRAREWSLEALKRRMCHALVFDERGEVVEPSSRLRKRPLIVERGRFRNTEPFHADMIRAAECQLREEGRPSSGKDVRAVLEMTIEHADGTRETDTADVLARVDRMKVLGTVVVTDYPQNYRLMDYLRRHTTEPVRVVMGVANLARTLHDTYGGLPGSLLEGLGKLLSYNVKIYAYPMPEGVFRDALRGAAESVDASPGPDGLVSLEDLRLSGPMAHLADYLKAAGWVAAVYCESQRTPAERAGGAAKTGR